MLNYKKNLKLYFVFFMNVQLLQQRHRENIIEMDQACFKVGNNRGSKISKGDIYDIYMKGKRRRERPKMRWMME